MRRRKLLPLVVVGILAAALPPVARSQVVDTGSIEFKASGTPGPNTIYLVGNRRESPEGLLTVEVWANEVTDLYGVSFAVRFPQSLVRYPKSRPTVFVEGPFLSEDGAAETALLVKEVGSEVVVGLSRVGEAPGLSGTGLLMTLEFKGLGVAGKKLVRLRERAAFDSTGASIDGVRWLAGKIIATTP